MLKISELDKKRLEQREKNKEERINSLNLFRLSLSERDPSQEKVLTTDSNRYLVKGPAGSGKTIIAVNKAFQLMKSGEESFIVLIYTKSLHRYLKGVIKKNYPEYQGMTVKVYYEEMKKETKIDADYVIIDEVQDFNINDLKKYLSEDKKGFFLFGDSGQQVFPEKTEGKDIISEIEKFKGLDVFNLDRTYRVPEKIAKFAACIDLHDTHIAENCYRVEGDIPLIIEFSSMEQEAKYICDRIRNELWKDVGIILKKNDDVEKMAALINANGIICEQKSENIDTLDFSSSNPKVLTYHSSKGLEFERVFIPECSENWNENKYNYQEALFVAITRAKETVIISYIRGDKNQHIDEFKDGTYKKVKYE